MEGINTGDHVNHQTPDATLQMSRFSRIDQSTGNQPVPPRVPQGQGSSHNMDPKRLKRVTASREYSQRYRLKQLQYIAQLEAGVRALQAEVAITVPRIKYADTQNALLRAENNSIKQNLAGCTGQLMFKQVEYHELKKERDALKQMSLAYHAPPFAAEISQAKHYAVNNLAMDQEGFNQFTAGAAGPSNRPNQKGNQFGFIPPDQNSFVPSGPNNDHNPM